MLSPAPPNLSLCSAALAYTLVSLGAAVLLALRSGRPQAEAASSRSSRAPRTPELLRLTLACCGTIALPALLLAPARQRAGSAAVTALLAFAPLAASAAAAVRRNASLPSSLGPGLLAFAGSLTLLQVAEPASVTAANGFALSCGAALVLGFSADAAHRGLSSWPPRRAMFFAASANALVFWIALWLQPATRARLADVTHPDQLPALLLETALAALSIFLLRSVPATVYTARFLLVPLIAAVESYVVLRPSLSWRAAIGAILLAAGAVALLRRDQDVPDEILGLREILLEDGSAHGVDSEHGRFDVHRRRG